MVKKRFTRFQIWEIIIVVLFILFMAYRMALIYDYIPKEYQPSVLFDDIYDRMKKDLKDESTQQSSFGRAAEWSLDRVNAVETYFREKRARYERAKEVSERCQENMLFRYFMFMGEEENTECAERNLLLKKQTEEIFNHAKKPAPQDAGQKKNTYTAPKLTPAEPGPTEPQTINVQGRTPLTPEIVTPKTVPEAFVPSAPVQPIPIAAPMPQPVAAPPPPARTSPGSGGRQPVSVTAPE